ncbi:MAG: hypothetical protein RLZZ436_4261 [Planctomycetota bacterium]|jgi:anti-sigma factor RsiW
MNQSPTVCESLAEDISLLAADCLPAPETLRLQQHLAACPGCHHHFEQLAAVVRELQVLHTDAQPAVVDKILKNVLTLLPGSSPHPAALPAAEIRRRTTSLPAAVSVVLLLAVFTRLAFWPASGRQPPAGGTGTASLAALNTSGSSPVPTLLDLTQAAAQSGESLDHLLSQYANERLFESLGRTTFRQEKLQ